MKIKKGNYFFVAYKGDHGPRHVHIYKDRKMIAKWDLENNLVMKGRMSGRLKKILNELILENKL